MGTWKVDPIGMVGSGEVKGKRPRLGEYEEEGEGEKMEGRTKRRKGRGLKKKKKKTTTRRRRRRREEQEMRRIRKTIEDPDQSTSSSPLVPMG